MCLNEGACIPRLKKVILIVSLPFFVLLYIAGDTTFRLSGPPFEMKNKITDNKQDFFQSYFLFSNNDFPYWLCAKSIGGNFNGVFLTVDFDESIDANVRIEKYLPEGKNKDCTLLNKDQLESKTYQLRPLISAEKSNFDIIFYYTVFPYSRLLLIGYFVVFMAFWGIIFTLKDIHDYIFESNQ